VYVEANQQVKTVGENIIACLSALQCYFSGPSIENVRNLTNKTVEPTQEIAPKGQNGASSGRIFSSTGLSNVFN